MQFYRCMCGAVTSWTTMGVPACARCDKCASDLAKYSGGHGEPAEHKYMRRYDAVTGAPYEICSGCLRRRSDLENAPQ
jgi:hypothetical protein